MKTRNAAVREAVKDRVGFFQGARRLEFALRVREKMKEKGLRNQDVAERLGVSEANVSRWLRGNQNIGLDTMYQLADAIEVPLNVDFGECFNAQKGQVEQSSSHAETYREFVFTKSVKVDTAKWEGVTSDVVVQIDSYRRVREERLKSPKVMASPVLLGRFDCDAAVGV